MTRKRILYISGSLGLGHITRDLAIAKELHRQNPEIEISWLAGSPASDLITSANEMLHPKCSQYANLNIPAYMRNYGTVDESKIFSNNKKL